MDPANEPAACNGVPPPLPLPQPQNENAQEQQNHNNNNNNNNVNNINNNQLDQQQDQQQVPNRDVNKDYVTVNGFGSSSQKSATRWRPRRRMNKSSICLTIILVTLFVILTLKLVVYIKYNRI